LSPNFWRIVEPSLLTNLHIQRTVCNLFENLFNLCVVKWKLKRTVEKSFFNEQMFVGNGEEKISVRMIFLALHTRTDHFEQREQKINPISIKLIVHTNNIKRVNISKKVDFKCSDMHGNVLINANLFLFCYKIEPFEKIDLWRWKVL
jgi:hypothetical protein